MLYRAVLNLYSLVRRSDLVTLSKKRRKLERFRQMKLRNTCQNRITNNQVLLCGMNEVPRNHYGPPPTSMDRAPCTNARHPSTQTNPLLGVRIRQEVTWRPTLSIQGSAQKYLVEDGSGRRKLQKETTGEDKSAINQHPSKIPEDK